ncbi:MAG: Rpn family recombination-promoting nuclease/putative transposase [Eubacteriales bacterium]|nr:Rpn family recombination-promoting nuclease/putative transposase [Eubacteriales bacterium]
MNTYLFTDFSLTPGLDSKYDAILKPATGPLPYRLTNDYLFKALFQKSPAALRGLICALLDLQPESIVSCEILNPIILGDQIDEKDCILDIRLVLNSNLKLNIELQIDNMKNWPQRSVYYTSRMYTELAPGQDYKEALPCIHIGILNESPFDDHSVFLSKYYLTDISSGHIYTSDFSIIMLNLSEIDHATEAQKQSDLYQWAKLFLATEYEEVKEMSKNSPVLKEAGVYIRELTSDEELKLRLEAREKYYADRKAIFSSGYDTGYGSGFDSALEKMNRLTGHLLSDNRLEDLKRCTSDPDFLQKLFQEYGISRSSSEK